MREYCDAGFLVDTISLDCFGVGDDEVDGRAEEKRERGQGETEKYTVMFESNLASLPDENSFNESHKRTKACTMSLRPICSHRDLQNSKVDV